MPVCARCGQDNPEGFRFCGACGSALDAGAEPPSEVRKVVTVLFADVTGSTAIGERLDPESLRRVMARYFDEARAALERHGGTVEKFIGDAVMAVFGVPVLHEDDALRAVRAAADLHAALTRLNVGLERDLGVSIQARVGVNTGEVVTGTEERLATGDAVNVAARLEQAAAPGETLVGDATYRLVRDAIRVEAVEPLVVKGKSEPVPAWRLVEVVAGAPAFARRLDSPLVGRGRERRLLAAAFEQLEVDRACRLFTVLGAVGVGKSRLVAEFVRDVDGRGTVLHGRCLPYGEGITFWPLAEALREAAGIGTDDPAEEARQRIAVLLADDEEANVVTDHVAALIGMAGAGGSPEEGFWSVRRLLEALARERPLVVVFDDVHWAEQAFLDLVENVADLSRDAPILLLCLARPELLDVRPAWGGGKLNATSILLEPLSEDECGVPLENLLGHAELAETIRARITGTAEGNPLFVEEMLAMLVDDGLLRRSNGSWIAAGDLGAVAVPPTVQAVLAARLDRLGSEERTVIGRAAVEGKLFHRGAVAELSPEPLRPMVQQHLTALLRKELIRPDRASFAGEDAFRFRHLLLRDAAYEALSKQVRAELHERFADWLERRTGERAAEYEEILGYHLEQAHRYRTELGPGDERSRAVADRAAERLAAAGGRAYARTDTNAAENLIGRAVALLPSGDPRRVGLLLLLGRVLLELGRFDEAERILAEAAESGNESLAGRARILALTGRFLHRPGGVVAEAQRELDALLPVFERLGDDAGLAACNELLHRVHWHGARAGAASLAAERASVHARRAGDRPTASHMAVWVGAGMVYGPAPVAEGIARLEEILREHPGERTAEAFAANMRAALEAMRGSFAEARTLHASAVATLLEFGLSVEAAAAVAHFGAKIELLAGDAAAAERLARSGYGELERMGEKSYLSWAAYLLAEALLALGRDDEALAATGASEEAAGADDVSSQIAWRGTRAKLLARRGELAGAERLAREAVALAAGTDWLALRGDALVALGEVVRLAGRPAEADGAAREALALYEQKGDVVSAARVRLLLEDFAATEPA